MNYLLQQKPLLIKNGISHWAAYKNWKDINYVYKIAGHRTIPIELGKKYDDENWSQGLFKFGEFLKLHMKNENSTNETAYLGECGFYFHESDRIYSRFVFQLSTIYSIKSQD